MGIFKKREEKESEAPETDQRIHEDLYKEMENASLPDHAYRAVKKELERLDQTDAAVAEYNVGLHYVKFILSLPWNKLADDNLDLEQAEQLLNAEHHGLTKVKERVLEHLAAGIMRRSKTFNILVVDDESIALENISFTLKKDNYNVSTASNGKEALELCKRISFDMVVTDLKMQQLDGIQLLEAVRQISPTTIFIITTGYATVETAVDALKKGAAHYLPKPLKLETLRQTVKKLLLEKRDFKVAQGSVLCFSGPPGIGKTSVGRSIANAFGRKFICLSVAGLRDEAELRGHRRTYVGAMPGRILSEIQKAGERNPVFMLDELDKIGQDFRGDPASVLLEVLDSKQNSQFLDYYLDIPFDLSQLMFITTVNVVEKLPSPLLDRMEVIPFSSYTMGEKRKIARDYLIPRQLEAHGLNASDLTFNDGSLDSIIQGYTREAGLRNLEREIARICRKMDRLIFQRVESIPIAIDEAGVHKLLGPPRFSNQSCLICNRPGVSTGLVWTEFGGQVILIETAIMKGDRNLIMTGSLGEILKESAQTALSFVRSRATEFGIDPDFYSGNDIHVHIPAGSVPKDGPSAGVTIAVALISLLTHRPCKPEIAMSGELTLSGQALPVSGLREKILAAQQAGIKMVIFPKSNESDIDGLDQEVSEAATVILAESIETIVEQALEKGGD